MRARTFHTNTPITGFQVPAASGGNEALACAASGLPGDLVFHADGMGSCPARSRARSAAPTTATSGQTVTVTAQDTDANRAAGDQGTLTFQAEVRANPTVAASPAPLPAPPPVV